MNPYINRDHIDHKPNIVELANMLQDDAKELTATEERLQQLKKRITSNKKALKDLL